MKVCEKCGDEIATKDGDGTCRACEDLDDGPRTKATQRARRNRKRNRQEKDDVLHSLGLVKVQGAMGGTYWE